MRKLLNLSFEGCESFEAEKIPTAWQAVNGGKLGLSQKHFKHGGNSLEWSW